MKKITWKHVVVKLKPKDLKKVLLILKKSKEPGRVIRRAMVLRLMDEGLTSPKVAKIIGITAKTARDIAGRYNKMGLERALRDQPHPRKAPTLNQKQRNHIIAMVCSSPPEGYARWTIRLIAEEAIKRKITKKTDRETVRILLNSHELKPWQKKNVVYS